LSRLDALATFGGAVSVFAQSFLDHLAGEARREAAPGLEDALTSALERAHLAWPASRVDDALFGRELAMRIPAGGDPLSALDSLNVADVYLAVACAGRDEAALAAFERIGVPEVRATLARMGLSGALTEETTQVMREELLVRAEGARPRILNYGGTGTLRAWLRSVAARTGLRLARKERGTEELHESMTAAADDDLELGYLKRRYAATFQEAFREALAAIPTKDRLLLKQRLRHHLSLEDMGAIYAVHASTVSRRVAEARERLVAETRDAMMRRLNVGRAEVSSILRLIYSEVDVTLSTVA
jgi:RNA polymerase sigma-70 factor (ECF subfamily)